MQGHRSSLTTLPENISFDHGTMPSDTSIDSQMPWNSMQTSAQNRLSSSGTIINTQYHHHLRHEGQNGHWILGETSSSAAQNHPYVNEGKIEQHTQIHSGNTLTLHEPYNTIPLQNDEINLNRCQTIILQNSSSDPISQDLNMISTQFGDDEDDDCQIVEYPNTIPSVGSSNVDTPGCSLDNRRMSCKRKAIEMQAGQFSGAGSSNSFQSVERSHWHHPIPANYITPTQTQNELVFDNSSSEQANPRPRLGGAVSPHPFSLTSSGNTENARRNFQVHINSLPHHPVPANSFLTEGEIGNRDVLPSRHAARLAVRNHLLDFNQVPSAETGSTPSGRRNPQTRWSRASSSRTTTSRSTVRTISPFPNQEHSTTNVPIPRTISEHPVFVPAATEIGSSSYNPTSWNLAGSNNSAIGNVVSAGGPGSSTGVNLPAAANWSHRSRSQYPQRLSEIVRRSLLSSSGSTEPGVQSMNHHATVGSSSSLTSQETVLLTGSHSHYRHMPSSWLERNLDSGYGIPHSLRTLAAASEGRSSIMSEIRHVLNLMRRGEGLRMEDVMLLDPSVFLGIVDIQDRHRDMRLDVDNMSYEELLALEERIGDVCTGLSEETIMNGLKQHKYVDSRSNEQVETEPCSICREEYNDGEDLGRLECGHDFHKECIKQWLVHKNSCPICKKAGLST